MIKVEVIEGFTLGGNNDYKFKDLKNIVRAEQEKEGELFVRDTFECTEDMAKYLKGENKLNRAFVKVIEVIPDEIKREEKKEEVVEEKPKKVTKKKTTKTNTKKGK